MTLSTAPRLTLLSLLFFSQRVNVPFFFPFLFRPSSPHPFSSPLDFDTCIEGVCTGVDLCISNDVSCPEPAECRAPGTCFRGVCSYPLLEEGTSCSDGDPLTDFDACTAAGVCQGVDLCEENDVVCAPLSQCHVPGTCRNGECSPSLPKADDTPCDDGNADTAGDVCREGTCVGILAAPGPCLAAVTCPGGECPAHPPLPDATPCPKLNNNTCVVSQCESGVCRQDVPQEAGVPCDDNQLRTDNDACNGQGACVGEDLCLAITCDPPSQPCLQAPECFRGNCSYALEPMGTTCDDGNERTVNETCTAEGSCEVRCRTRLANSCSTTLEITFHPTPPPFPAFHNLARHRVSTRACPWVSRVNPCHSATRLAHVFWANAAPRCLWPRARRATTATLRRSMTRAAAAEPVCPAPACARTSRARPSPSATLPASATT